MEEYSVKVVEGVNGVKVVDLGLELGFVGSGRDESEKLRGERVGALGRGGVLGGV